MSFEDYIRNNKKELKEKEVNADLWDRINDNLDIPKKKINNYIILVFLIVFGGLAFLFSGYTTGYYKQNIQLKETEKELFALKKKMYELIEDQSSFKRIKAVNMSRSVEHMDNDMVNVLLKIMAYDENEKVRLSAINALERLANKRTVKSALINALKNSNEPFFKIKIINILASIKEEKSLPLLNRIIDDKASEGYLKEEAISAKQLINEI